MFSKSNSSKAVSLSTPTYTYFINESNKEEMENNYRAACKYIRQQYPQAEPGSNYWLSINTKSTPLPDQYFLRRLTFRSCIPPYEDQDLKAFEDTVRDFVKKTVMQQKKILHEKESELTTDNSSGSKESNRCQIF